MVAVRQLIALLRLAFSAMIVAAALSCTARAAEQVDLKIRLAWGGGEAVRWRGRIWLDNGTIERAIPIGLDEDSVRTFRALPTAVNIAAHNRRDYEAVDLSVRAPLSANLHVALGAWNRTEPKIIAVPISKLVAGDSTESLDDQGNQLKIQRSPGDRLRVDVQRDHLVFSPGESWELRVRPHRLGTSFPTSAILQVQLFVGRSQTELWSQQQQLTINDSGAIDEKVSVTVPIPDQEGVYDLELAVVRPRARALIAARETVVRRRVQFVVLAATEAPSETKGWSSSPVLEFDPAQPKLFRRLPGVSPWTALAPGQPRSFGSRSVNVVQRGDARAWTQLAGDGWQAYALPINRPGELHMLEIEYPSDLRQTLGISLMEPNAAGKVVPVGVDGAIHVEAVTNDTNQKRRPTYHLIFWPRTRLPYLVLTNRKTTQPAMFGAIRVYHRDGSLPRVPVDRPATGNRFAVARFSRPLFPELFGATDAIDEQTGQALDDWKTFYDGAKRLIEYARYLGYDAISVTALCEGSAIFPLTDLKVTPKYDTGIYFSNGQDPIRKDVLELLYRLCDRNGIKLIPAFEFSERSTSHDPQSQQAPARQSPDRVLPIQNPLDRRVQAALVGVVEQATKRYAHHESFGGIGITLGNGTGTHLPGPYWPSDPATVAEFGNSTALRPGQTTRDHQRMLQDPSYRERWLRWRAQRLHGMYDRMAQSVRAAKPAAQVYLSIENLITDRVFADAMRPRLPDASRISQSLLDMGILPKLYSEAQGLVLLRPHRYDPLKPLAVRQSQSQMNHDIDFRLTDALPSSRGSSFFHVPQVLRLSDLDEQSPFEETFALVAPQILPTGAASRRHLVQALALHDVRTWFDGGWTAIRDQHEWLAPVIDVFRRLPEQRFTTAEIPTSLGDRFVVRSLNSNGITYAYIVNNSPWAVNARLQLDVPASGELKALTPYKSSGSLQIGNDGVWWHCRLEPYDVVAGVVTSHDVRIVRILTELPDDVLPELRDEIAELSTRIPTLGQPQEQPLGDNGGFESVELVGWTSTQDVDVHVDLDTDVVRSGKRSLRIASQAPVAWLRSESFAPPASGRVLLRVWSKHSGPSSPRLRLIAESAEPDKSFSRQIELTMMDKGSTDWQSYDLWFDDVPGSLRELRFGVDVLGPGTVWLDDVQVLDLPFSRSERNELSKMIALADLQLREGRVGDCRTTLDGYWMQFLQTYVPPAESRVARAPNGNRQPPADEPAKTQPIPKTSNALDRLKRFVPIFRR